MDIDSHQQPLRASSVAADLLWSVAAEVAWARSAFESGSTFSGAARSARGSREVEQALDTAGGTTQGPCSHASAALPQRSVRSKSREGAGARAETVGCTWRPPDGSRTAFELALVLQASDTSAHTPAVEGTSAVEGVAVVQATRSFAQWATAVAAWEGLMFSLQGHIHILPQRPGEALPFAEGVIFLFQGVIFLVQEHIHILPQ